MTSVAFFELILLLVAGALALSLAAGRMRLPPAAALVVGGMVLALVPGVPAFALDPNLILVLFLPPLLLASAYETVWRDFRAQLRPILLLSVGAVVFTTLCVAAVAHLLVPGLPWAACVALGAIVSPPDAVAAKAVLQRLTLPPQLMTIIEGESLVNDASGLVLYRFAVVAALTGGFSAGEAGLSFVWMVVAGVALGWLCGLAAAAIMKRLGDDTAIILTSFFLPYVAYILAERIEASGVLAVVTAGSVVSLAGHQVFRASARTKAGAVWETVVYLLEAFVFVLIGLSLRGLIERHGGGDGALLTALPLALAVTATVVVSRFAYVFPSAFLSRAAAAGAHPAGAELGRHARCGDARRRARLADRLPRPGRHPSHLLRGDPVHRACARHDARAADRAARAAALRPATVGDAARPQRRPPRRAPRRPRFAGDDAVGRHRRAAASAVDRDVPHPHPRFRAPA